MTILVTYFESYEDDIKNHEEFHRLVLKYCIYEKLVTAYLFQLCQTLRAEGVTVNMFTGL